MDIQAAHVLSQVKRKSNNGAEENSRQYEKNTFKVWFAYYNIIHGFPKRSEWKKKTHFIA